MGYFIVGDIHGCDYTFSTLLQHWNRATEKLICVGDYVDKGNFSSLATQRCMALDQDTTLDTVFLKGNHELEFIRHFETGDNPDWYNKVGQTSISQFERDEVDLPQAVSWFKQLPIKFDAPELLVTHAGLADTVAPFNELNLKGILWNKQPLMNIHKLQVHGHKHLRAYAPQYDPEANAWNIDTGACYGFGLCALRLNFHGEVLEHLFIKTDKRDYSAS